jgi:hypothetical protein
MLGAAAAGPVAVVAGLFDVPPEQAANICKMRMPMADLAHDVLCMMFASAAFPFERCRPAQTVNDIVKTTARHPYAEARVDIPLAEAGAEHNSNRNMTPAAPPSSLPTVAKLGTLSLCDAK